MLESCQSTEVIDVDFGWLVTGFAPPMYLGWLSEVFLMNLVYKTSFISTENH